MDGQASPRGRSVWAAAARGRQHATGWRSPPGPDAVEENHTGAMTEVLIAHTAALDPGILAAARDLLFVVFDDMTDEDWEHSLGGLHAIAWDGTEVVGHAALVQRRLLHGGRALRAGYVEGVAVRADHRRQGIAAAMMAELERRRGAHTTSVLWAPPTRRCRSIPAVAGCHGGADVSAYTGRHRAHTG